MESESVSEKGRPYFQLQYNIYLYYIVHIFFLFFFLSIFRWYKYELYLLPIVMILIIFAGIMITTYIYVPTYYSGGHISWHELFLAGNQGNH